MRRGDFYIKLTTAVLFIAVIAYIGVYLVSAISRSYETVTAVRFTLERTFSAQGYIVRTESVLSDSGHVVLPIVAEGEKVASGQAIVVEYMSREALETANEIRALRLLISQLETSGSADSAEASRQKSVMDLSKAIGLGEFRRLEELTLGVEANVFSGISGVEADLPALRTRLEALETRASGIRMVYAPFSGIFSQAVDGFEHIVPDMVFDILPNELTTLFLNESYISGYGKLVTEFKWYYATIMNADEAALFSEGQQTTVQLAGPFAEAMEMTIELIGRREGDKCVVLFSSSRGIHEVAHMRHLRADILFDLVTGIRVPKEAIHLDDDGNTVYIYLQTGVRAERVNVDILIESSDSYLVRDGAQTGSPLRAGSTIIVKANNLFDGKVVA